MVSRPVEKSLVAHLADKGLISLPILVFSNIGDNC